VKIDYFDYSLPIINKYNNDKKKYDFNIVLELLLANEKKIEKNNNIFNNLLNHYKDIEEIKNQLDSIIHSDPAKAIVNLSTNEQVESLHMIMIAAILEIVIVANINEYIKDHKNITDKELMELYTHLIDPVKNECLALIQHFVFLNEMLTDPKEPIKKKYLKYKHKYLMLKNHQENLVKN
jgi:hypothetical protein